MEQSMELKLENYMRAALTPNIQSEPNHSLSLLYK